MGTPKARPGRFGQEAANRMSGPRDADFDRPERARWRDLVQHLARRLDAPPGEDGGGLDRQILLLSFRTFLPLVDPRWWQAYPPVEMDDFRRQALGVLQELRSSGAEAEWAHEEIGKLRIAAADAIDVFARKGFPEGVQRAMDLFASFMQRDEPQAAPGPQAPPSPRGTGRATDPPAGREAEAEPESRAALTAAAWKTRNHLTPAELRSMRLREQLHPREVNHLLRHLGTGCAVCWQAFDDSLYPSGGEEDSVDPTVLALRTLAAETHRELCGRHRGAAEAARQRPLGLAFLLLEEARKVAHGAPELAPHLIDVLQMFLADPELEAYDPRAYRDLQARSYAYLALAHQLNEDLAAAGPALDRAEAELAQGTGDPELEGAVLYIRASWLGDGGQIDEAFDVFCRAAELLENVEPIDSAVEVLIQCATLLDRVYGEPDEAQPLLEEGVRLMDSLPAGTNPTLSFGLRHELARVEMSLARNRGAAASEVAPDFSAAAARLREIEPIYEQCTDPEVLEERRQMLAEIEAAEKAQLIN